MELDKDIEAYEAIRLDLEATKNGQWALVYKCELIGVFSSFEEAAKLAVEKFGHGPYLIRQIGAPSVTLPASVMYTPLNG